MYQLVPEYHVNLALEGIPHLTNFVEALKSISIKSIGRCCRCGRFVMQRPFRHVTTCDRCWHDIMYQISMMSDSEREALFQRMGVDNRNTYI